MSKNEFPSSWVETNLENVADWGSGGTPSRKRPDFYEGEIPWLKTGELGPSIVRDTQEKISEKALKSSSAKLFPKGSIVLAMYGATIGKASILGIEMSTNQACAVGQPVPELIELSYLYTYIFSQKREFAKAGIGGAQPNISQGVIKTWPLPLPPLNEQKRIVAKIEELFSELDAGVASLKQARTQLGTYRQALLKQAFEGKLTAQWRRDHPAQLESPEKLLTRIQEERETRYQSNLQNWQTAVEEWEASGKEGKKPTKPRKPKTLTPENTLNPPSYPTDWIASIIAQLCEVGTGITPLKARADFYEDGNIPWITSTVVNNDMVRIPNGFVTSKAVAETKLKLFPEGSLIVALYGEGKTRGKVSELAIQTTVNQALAVLVMEGSSEPIRPYLKFFLIKNYIEIRKKSAGGVQPNLNLGLVETTTIPLCSLPEQREIVRLLEEQFTAIEQNEREIEASLRRAEALRQSILKRAFSGQLVPQDPTDEPASQLLARIQEERSERAVQASKKPKKKAPRKITSQKDS